MSNVRNIKKRKKGFTLIEVLIVVGIIALLVVIFAQNTLSQLAKSRDAERKTDLQDIKIAFEHYYDDNNIYPTDLDILDDCGGEFENYLREIPCDPQDNTPYIYDPYPDGSAYRILTKLENTDDEVIKELACDGSNGCGYLSRPNYNYGTSVGRRVSDTESSQNPDDPEEPPVDPCANQEMQNFICEEDPDGGGTCQSCADADCPPGEIVYGCYASCVEQSSCVGFN